jgi:hypothetical protein
MSTVDTAALSGRAGTVGGIYGTIAAVVLVVGGLAVVARYIQLRSGSDICGPPGADRLDGHGGSS